MLECKDVRPLLADYEAGNLPAEQAGQMEDHLLLCPICAAALEDLRREKDRAAVMPAAASALEVADVAESTQVCVSFSAEGTTPYPQSFVPVLVPILL